MIRYKYNRVNIKIEHALQWVLSCYTSELIWHHPVRRFTMCSMQYCMQCSMQVFSWPCTPSRSLCPRRTAPGNHLCLPVNWWQQQHSSDGRALPSGSSICCRCCAILNFDQNCRCLERVRKVAWVWMLVILKHSVTNYIYIYIWHAHAQRKRDVLQRLADHNGLLSSAQEFILTRCHQKPCQARPIRLQARQGHVHCPHPTHAQWNFGRWRSSFELFFGVILMERECVHRLWLCRGC